MTSAIPADDMPSPRRWIDVLLVAAGAFCATRGLIWAAVPLVAFGLVAPAVAWRTRRREGPSLARLAPPEVTDAHAAVVTAATLPGIPDPKAVVEAADDLLYDVAAVLVGRPARGAAQRRFVVVHTRVLTAMAADLHERHAAWTAAMAEVDAISPQAPTAPASPTPEKDGALVTALLVALSPGFIAWDLVCGTVRGLVGLRDGLTLRMRAVARLVLRAIAAVGDLLVRTARAWRSVRLRVAAAGSEARHRFLATRVRLRHRLRTLRRAAH
jgi:hypothetical protein